MFGFKYIKFEANTYVIRYSNGKIKQEGRGLSFFYFAPSTSIVGIPMGSNDIQFIFNEMTQDFQQITIQGQLTYNIENPKQLAELLDFTVDRRGNPLKNELEKLNQRLINETQTTTSAFVRSLTIREAIQSVKKIELKIAEGLQSSEVVKMLGINILAMNVLEAKPSSEMQRALETTTREALQQEADLAIYERRNFAVEQERKIKESELNTEIVIEDKKKQIVEKQMETDILKEENDRKLRQMKMGADIEVEKQRKELIDMETDNQRKTADAKGYVLKTILEPYKDLDWKTLMAIQNINDSKTNISLAFRELAENADKIGTLNLTPDLLNELTKD